MEALRTFIAFFLRNNLERTNAKQHISGNMITYLQQFTAYSRDNFSYMVVHASIKGIVTTVTQSAWHSMLDSMLRSRMAMGMPVMPIYIT